MRNVKYTWIELDLKKRLDDFRPESYSPLNYDFKDIVIGDRINTDGNWYERKQYCLRNIYTNKNKLLEDSKAPKNISLATFKPTKVLGVECKEDDRHGRQWY